MATRDRTATEDRILAAVGLVLARDGFGGIGVNAIAREAGVDKVLIYRYFGGLSELLQAWGASGRFWPRVQDLLGDDPQALLDLPLAERYARFFEHFIDELRRRPLTLEVLAAEVAERNALTAILEAEREQWGQEASRMLGGAGLQARPHAGTLTLLLVAGVQYLLLRSRHIRIFGALDIRTDEGWQSVKDAVRALASQLFGEPPTAPPVTRPGSGAKGRGRRPAPPTSRSRPRGPSRG